MCELTLPIILGLLVIACVLFSLLSSNKEGFSSGSDYSIPYGMVTDHYAKGNPVSYDMKVYPPSEQAKYPKPTGNTYFGHGIPLANEEHKTELEGQSLLKYADRQCRADCCHGPLVTDYSCSSGCVCNQ